MTTDPKTGLPKLPEHYFWRVKQTYGKFYYVAVRKNVYLFGYKLFSYEVAEEMVVTLTENNIRREARDLYNKLFVDSQSTLLGDYPPKNLNATTESTH